LALEPPRGSEKDFPLYLVAHPASNLAGGFLPNPPFLNKTLFDTQLLGNDMFVQIHPRPPDPWASNRGIARSLKHPRGRHRFESTCPPQPGRGWSTSPEGSAMRPTMSISGTRE